MSDRLTNVVAVLAVVALGLAAGAVLTEAVALVPFWRALPPESFLAWFRENTTRLFNFFAPLEIVATVLAIAAAVLARARGHAGAASLVLGAVLAVLVLVPYPLYFQGVNASFATGTIAVERVADELARWEAWHWLRTAIAVGAFAAAAVGLGRGTGAP
jgi:hypothetical protein